MPDSTLLELYRNILMYNILNAIGRGMKLSQQTKEGQLIVVVEIRSSKVTVV